MSATDHWAALDAVVSRLLPGPAVVLARERFARRAAALNDIHVTRLLKAEAGPATDDVQGRVEELRRTHCALTATLTSVWIRDP
jgi:hypothetical protein